MNLTLKHHNLDATESRVIRPLRLSERPLEMHEVARIARLTEHKVRRTMARLMGEALVDQVAGGFIPTDAGRAASLDH